MRELSSALVWLRRDLRLHDNAALYAALKASQRVWCAFVFDTDPLDRLSNRRDRRVDFIRESLVELNGELAARGGGLIVRHGRALEEVPSLAKELRVAAVFANHDYEPEATARDAAVARALRVIGVQFVTRKDQVIFEKDEVLSAGGKPYSVFTPYKNAWLKRLVPFFVKAYPVEKYLDALAPLKTPSRVPELGELRFERTNLSQIGIPTGVSGARKLLDDFLTRIDEYRERRDYPAVRGSSYLSLHLRFGTVSVRELATLAQARKSAGADTWLTELIWRDFSLLPG